MLAAMGYDLFLLARNEEALEGVVAENMISADDAVDAAAAGNQ